MDLTELKLLVGEALSGPAVEINLRAAEARARRTKDQILDLVICMPYCSCLRCQLENEDMLVETFLGKTGAM